MKASVVVFLLGIAALFFANENQWDYPTLSTLIGIFGGLTIVGGLLGVIAHIIPLDSD